MTGSRVGGYRICVALVCAAAVVAACGSTSSPSTSDASLSPDALAGKRYSAAHCGSCHSTNGSKGLGATFKGLAGSSRKLTTGQTVVADDAYLTQAIDDPDSQIVAGYHAGVMSAPFPKGSVSPTQTRQLVAYIDSLK